MRYFKPFRLFLMWLLDYVPEKLENKILDYLYPNDCVIEFKGDNE
jgi:hypothetical protein